MRKRLCVCLFIIGGLFLSWMYRLAEIVDRETFQELDAWEEFNKYLEDDF